MPATWADKVGVNIHPPSYPRYANVAAITARLNWLGVKWIRMDSPSGFTNYPGFNVVSMCTTGAQATTAKGNGADIIESINEPDGPAGGNITAASARSIGLAIVSAAGTTPTVSTGLADPWTGAGTYPTALGDIGADYGNVHIYRANRSPSAYASWKASHYQNLAPLAPNKDYMVTETGTHDCLSNPPNGHTPTPQYIAAEQMIPDLQAYFTDNPAGTTGSCIRVFQYELQASASTDYDADTNIQHYFGLFYADGTPKEHAFQLRELLHS